jgi:hypothetical protein
VESIFSDTYLTTVGVKIDKKTLTVGAEPVTLILWDIAGEDESNQITHELLARRGDTSWWRTARGRKL